jgi:hypothetical protein
LTAQSLITISCAVALLVGLLWHLQADSKREIPAEVYKKALEEAIFHLLSKQEYDYLETTANQLYTLAVTERKSRKKESKSEESPTNKPVRRDGVFGCRPPFFWSLETHSPWRDLSCLWERQ